MSGRVRPQLPQGVVGRAGDHALAGVPVFLPIMGAVRVVAAGMVNAAVVMRAAVVVVVKWAGWMETRAV